MANSTTSFFALPNGAGLQVTTARVSAPGGSSYPDAVTPDVAVKDDLLELSRGRDLMLSAALERLRD